MLLKFKNFHLTKVLKLRSKVKKQNIKIKLNEAKCCQRSCQTNELLPEIKPNGVELLPKINQTEWNVAKYQETNEQTLEYDDIKETNQNERKKNSPYS